MTDDSDDGRPTKIKGIHESIEASESHTLVVREDERGVVRVSHTSSAGDSVEADAKGGGSVAARVKGDPPEGEELTLAACRILVRSLNSQGGDWSDPYEGEEASHSDCVACKESNPDRELHIQVVQAIIESDLWEHWAEEGGYDHSAASPNAVAGRLTEAIEKKVERIPEGARDDLILALNALRTPGASLEPVVEEFRGQYADEVGALGFDQVWLVGLNDSLVWRLDVRS